jgi:hypothetical protein
MRVIALCLLVAAGASAAEDFRHPAGLRLAVPDGWKHDVAREVGSTAFAATYDAGKAGYVEFIVEGAPTREGRFDAKRWLKDQEAQKREWIRTVTRPFTAIPGARIGDRPAVGYAFAGTTAEGDAEPGTALRYEVYVVEIGDHYYELSEVSVGDGRQQPPVRKAVRDMWEGVSFQAEDEEEGGGGLKPAEGASKEFEDKEGNYKGKLPPGWEIEREAPLEGEVQHRMTFVRKLGDDNVCGFQVFRWQLSTMGAGAQRASQLFHSGTPNDILEIFHKEVKFFDGWYGQSASENINPQMDESFGFAGAGKAGQYEIRSITMEEMANVAAAEKKIRKGEKGVEMPKYKPLVIRGRIGMVSPYIYMTRVVSARSLADDAQLMAEVKQIHDSVELLESGAMPPPLEVLGKAVGDSVKDPANEKDRKMSAVHDARGKKTYRVEWNFVLPAGCAAQTDKLPGDVSFVCWAQDHRNNWIRLMVVNVSHKKAADENKRFDDETTFNTWKSNWTGKARGTKVPSKPQKFSLGKARGKGYKQMSGKVTGFKGTFTGIVSDKFPGKGWRTVIEIETRGNGDEQFADSLKKLLKSFKAKNLKVK